MNYRNRKQLTIHPISTVVQFTSILYVVLSDPKIRYLQNCNYSLLQIFLYVHNSKQFERIIYGPRGPGEKETRKGEGM